MPSVELGRVTFSDAKEDLQLTALVRATLSSLDEVSDIQERVRMQRLCRLWVCCDRALNVSIVFNHSSGSFLEPQGISQDHTGPRIVDFKARVADTS